MIRRAVFLSLLFVGAGAGTGTAHAAPPTLAALGRRYAAKHGSRSGW